MMQHSTSHTHGRTSRVLQFRLRCVLIVGGYWLLGFCNIPELLVLREKNKKQVNGLLALASKHALAGLAKGVAGKHCAGSSLDFFLPCSP